jgi:hypothetical protein
MICIGNVEFKTAKSAGYSGNAGRKRLGLIFGSGSSKDLGFPDWNELVNRIGKDENVDAESLLEAFTAASDANNVVRSLPSITHILYDHYRNKNKIDDNIDGP